MPRMRVHATQLSHDVPSRLEAYVCPRTFTLIQGAKPRFSDCWAVVWIWECEKWTQRGRLSMFWRFDRGRVTIFGLLMKFYMYDVELKIASFISALLITHVCCTWCTVRIDRSTTLQYNSDIRRTCEGGYRQDQLFFIFCGTTSCTRPIRKKDGR